MMKAAILRCKRLAEDIKKAGCALNPCEPCVANKLINGKQHAIIWHVDKAKSSHADPKINDKFSEWCESMRGSDALGHAKVARGKLHDYLGTTLDCSEKGKLKVDMRDHVKSMDQEWPYELEKERRPWRDSLFKADKASKPLDEVEAKTHHRLAMKSVLLCKRGFQTLKLRLVS